MGDDLKVKIDVACPITGTDYVTTITSPTEGSSMYASSPSINTVTVSTEDYSFAGDNLTYTLDGIDNISHCINEPAQEFVTHLPTMEKIEKMCEQYPGLKKAYEHFVFAYKLTRQDYDGKIKAGELDD